MNDSSFLMVNFSAKFQREHRPIGLQHMERGRRMTENFSLNTALKGFLMTQRQMTLKDVGVC